MISILAAIAGLALLNGPAISFQPDAPPLPAAMSAQVEITPTVRRVIQFTDNGRTYTIDLDTMRIWAADAANVQPIPQPPAPPKPEPNPTPDPEPPKPPPAVVGKAAFVSLIIAPYKPDQAGWLADDRVRAAVAKAGAKFRGFRSTEQDVDDLNYRPLARKNEVPLIVIQDEKGAVLFDRKVESVEDIIKAVELRK